MKKSESECFIEGANFGTNRILITNEIGKPQQSVGQFTQTFSNEFLNSFHRQILFEQVCVQRKKPDSMFTLTPKRLAEAQPLIDAAWGKLRVSRSLSVRDFEFDLRKLFATGHLEFRDIVHQLSEHEEHRLLGLYCMEHYEKSSGPPPAFKRVLEKAYGVKDYDDPTTEAIRDSFWLFIFGSLSTQARDGRTNEDA